MRAQIVTKNFDVTFLIQRLSDPLVIELLYVLLGFRVYKSQQVSMFGIASHHWPAAPLAHSVVSTYKFIFSIANIDIQVHLYISFSQLTYVYIFLLTDFPNIQLGFVFIILIFAKQTQIFMLVFKIILISSYPFLKVNKKQKMSQSKIQALKNSYRKAAVKQEILPHIQPLVKPTRDVSIENRTVSLNLKQSVANDSFAHQRKIQQLQRQLQDLQFQHQANIVYNKQFKILGKLFGNESLDFEEIKQKIQNTILNANCGIGTQSQHHTVASNLQKLGSSFEQDQFSTQILGYSKDELKEKLLLANRSEFLSILQLGSGIVLQNEPAQQRKRKNVREMFYQIWRDVLNSNQQASQKLNRLLQMNDQSTSAKFIEKKQQRSSSYETRILEKNRNIADLAEQLEKVNDQLAQKEKKLRMYKDNYDTIEKEYESANSQIKDHIQQIQALKKMISSLQDKIRDYEDKQYTEQLKAKDNRNEIQLLRLELKEAKQKEEKKCNQMIITIDQLMANVSKYDSTIFELESQKNENLRQIWVEKAKNEQMADQLKNVQAQLLKEKQRYQRIQIEVSEARDRRRDSDNENQKRMHQLNEQILSIREEHDHKARAYQLQIQNLRRAKEKAESEFDELLRQCQILKDRGNMDSEPHTAVFGGAKLSQDMQLRTSIIDDRLVQLEQALKNAHQFSQKEIARLGNQLIATKNGQQQKQRRIRQIQNYLDSLKNINVSQQITISQFRDQNKNLSKQISSLQQQIGAYKQRIKELQSHLEQQYISMNMQKEHYGDQVTKMKQQYEKAIIQTAIVNHSTLKRSSDGKVQQKNQEIVNVTAKLEEQLSLNKGIQEKVMGYESLIKDFELKFNLYAQQESQYKENIKTMEKQFGIIKNQNQLLSQTKMILEEEKNRLEKALRSIQQDHAEKYKKMNAFIAERNGLISHLQAQIKQLETALNQPRDSLKIVSSIPNVLDHSLQISPAKESSELKSPQLMALEEQIKRYQQHIQESKQNLSKAHRYIKELEELIEEKEQTVFQFQTQFTGKDTSSVKKLQPSKENDQIICELQTKCVELEEEVNGNLEFIRARDIHIQQLKTTLASMVDELTSAKIQLTKTSGQLTSTNQQNSNLKKELENVNKQLREIVQQVHMLEVENNSMSEFVETIKQLNQTLRSQNSSLKEANDRLKSDVSNLTSNNNILFEQKSHLLEEINDLNERLRLSSEKLQISAVNAQGDSSKRIMHKYGSVNGNEARSDLQTIKEIMNSQNEIEQDGHDNKHMLHEPSIHLSTKQTEQKIQGSNSDRYLRETSQHKEAARRQSMPISIVSQTGQFDLRLNQAYKTKDQIQQEKKSLSNGSEPQAQVAQYDYKYRPAIQKNSAKYEALLKQSQDLERMHLEGTNQQISSLKITPKDQRNERDFGSPQSKKTIIQSINKIGNENNQHDEGSSRQIASNSSANYLEDPEHGLQTEFNQEDIEQERDTVNEVAPSAKTIQSQSSNRQQISSVSTIRNSSTHHQQSQGYNFVTDKFKNINQFYSQQVIEQRNSNTNHSAINLPNNIFTLQPQQQQQQETNQQTISPKQSVNEIPSKQTINLASNNQPSSNASISQSEVNRTQKQEFPQQRSSSGTLAQRLESEKNLVLDESMPASQNTDAIVNRQIIKMEQAIIDNNASSLPNSSVSQHSQPTMPNTTSANQQYRTEQVISQPQPQPFSQQVLPHQQTSTQQSIPFLQTNQQFQALPSSDQNINASKYSNDGQQQNGNQSGYSGSMTETKRYTNQQAGQPINLNQHAYYSRQSSSLNSDLSNNLSNTIKYGSIHQHVPHTERHVPEPPVSSRIYTQANIVQNNENTLGRVTYVTSSSRPSMPSGASIVQQTRTETRIDRGPRIVRVSASNVPALQSSSIIRQQASQTASNIQQQNQIIGQPKAIKDKPIGSSANIVPVQEVSPTKHLEQSSMSMLSKIIMESGTQNNIRNTTQIITNQEDFAQSQRASTNQISRLQSQPQIQPQIQAGSQKNQGLDGSSKSVVSQQDVKQQNIDSPQPLPLPISIVQSPSTRTITNNNSQLNNEIQAQIIRNYGPNVISAESETTFRLMSQKSPTSHATINKQVSLKLDEQASLSNQQQQAQQSGTYASDRSIQEAIMRSIMPVVPKTDQIIPIPQPQQSFSQVASSPKIMMSPNQPYPPHMQVIQNRYPSPSKVVIVERIDKSGHQKQLRPKPGQFSMNMLPANSSINRNRFSQIEQARMQAQNGQQSLSRITQVVHTQHNIHSTNKVLSLNSQPSLSHGRRPSPTQMHILNTVHQLPGAPQLLVNPINPFEIINSSGSRISLSPPHGEKVESLGSSSKMDRRMFETFNPNSSKRVSIYTNKPEIRAESPSQRSLSPPAMPTPINGLVSPRSTNQLPVPINPRQLAPQVKQSQISNYSEAYRQNPSKNDLSVYKSAIMMLDTKSHKRSNSLQEQIPQRKLSRFKTEINSGGASPYFINGARSNPTSVKVFETLQRPISNMTTPLQNQVSYPVSNSQPPQMMAPSTIYGMENAKTIKFKPATPTFKQLNQVGQTTYSTRPITRQNKPMSPVTPPTINTEYYAQNGISSKQQQQQEIFSSKHRIIDGMEDSNSSGIQVQQRDSSNQCCPRC